MVGLEVVGLIAHILVFYGIYVILALSFNLEYGFTGLPNFGKVLFYSLGAYAAGTLSATLATSLAEFTTSTSPPYCDARAIPVMSRLAATNMLFDIGVFIVGLFLAAIVGFIAGVVASYPTLKLRGDFLAITLLALGEVVRIIASTEKWPVCGIIGLTGIPTPFAWIGDPDTTRLAYACLVLAFAAIIYVLVELVSNSPWGRLLKAIRDDELAVEVYGRNPVKTKAEVMAFGSMLAAIAGALYAFYVGGVYPRDFIPIVTFMVVVMVMLGGPANNKGVLLGAAIVTLMDQLFNASIFNALGIPLPRNILLAIPYIKYMVMGILIVLLLMYRPQGLIPEKPLRTPVVDEMKRILYGMREGKEENQLPITRSTRYLSTT